MFGPKGYKSFTLLCLCIFIYIYIFSGSGLVKADVSFCVLAFSLHPFWIDIMPRGKNMKSTRFERLVLCTGSSLDEEYALGIPTQLPKDAPQESNKDQQNHKITKGFPNWQISLWEKKQIPAYRCMSPRQCLDGEWQNPPQKWRIWGSSHFQEVSSGKTIIIYFPNLQGTSIFRKPIEISKIQVTVAPSAVASAIGLTSDPVRVFEASLGRDGGFGGWWVGSWVKLMYSW